MIEAVNDLEELCNDLGTDVSAGARLATRRERTLTADDNFLSATGKKLLMDVGGSSQRNGETCRVIALKLNGANNTQVNNIA